MKKNEVINALREATQLFEDTSHLEAENKETGECFETVSHKEIEAVIAGLRSCKKLLESDVRRSGLEVYLIILSALAKNNLPKEDKDEGDVEVG